jgi:hypothetical protein
VGINILQITETDEFEVAQMSQAIMTDSSQRGPHSKQPGLRNREEDNSAESSSAPYLNPYPRMKGLAFTGFLEMVESAHGVEQPKSS